MIKLKWEPVETGSVGCAGRCPVPGGWILQFVESNQPVTYMFIPDLGHTWGRLEEKRKNLETVYKDLEEMSSTNTKPRIAEKQATTIEGDTIDARVCSTCYGRGKTSAIGDLIKAETCVVCNGTGVIRVAR